MEAMTTFLQDKLHLSPSPAEAQQGELLHMVMVPYPLQGHINPMMQFAKALIAKHTIKISFINIKYNHERIQKSRIRLSSLMSPCANAKSPSELESVHNDTLKSSKRQTNQTEGRAQKKLELLWIDNGLPDDYEYTGLASLHAFHNATFNMKDPLKQLLKSLNQKSQPISCVIFGSFSFWIHTVSAELGIPSVFFWTQSAGTLSIYYHAPLLDANGFFPYKKHPASGCNEEHGTFLETSKLVSYVPGVPPLAPSSIPTLLHVDDTSDSIYTSLREQFDILKSCQALIVNSFEELESDAYKAMQQELPFPVSLVGPLVPLAFLDEGDANDTSSGASLLEERTECIEWLNRQKKRSVLYISFGSLQHLSDEDIASISNGIKDSKQPFLWVLRPKSSAEDIADLLPKGFMDETKEKGLIIPWVPQTQVLAHPSVGAFLTHCGWNSTLESVSMGVPMITCPFLSDQPTNATYVREFWKNGMPLKRQEDGTIRSLDVERVVRIVLEDKEGEEIRKNAISIRETARQAARAQGSSCKAMEQFVRTIRSLSKGK